MRKTFMFTQKGSSAYLEDMTFRANFEFGNSGACGRR
jgi:hypothetical protein